MIDWFRAATGAVLLSALWCALTLLTGCAATVPPVPQWLEPIVIAESEPSHRLVCVRALPFLDTSVECMTVGGLRRLLRSQQMARRESGVGQ